MITCSTCIQKTLIHYNHKTYCTYLPCSMITSRFIYYFLQTLDGFVYTPIMNKIKLAKCLQYWKHPLDILMLTTLSFKTNNVLFNFIKQDLNQEELGLFHDSLMWMEAFRDYELIHSLYYPTMQHQHNELNNYCYHILSAKKFLNKFIQEHPDKTFYYQYFTSEYIHSYIKTFLTWLDHF